MSDHILEKYVNDFRVGTDVSPDDVGILFDALIGSGDSRLLARLLEVWSIKGATQEELFGLATIMRQRMKRIDSRGKTAVDIVGTGGSGAKTFNVSTAAAFVVSGSGVPVAKHGNGAATSKSGSFDCLSLLGVNADVEPALVQQCFDQLGICFMFAPRFHALSPSLAAARRSLASPTIFNNLGPVCNPASPPYQVIGVWTSALLDKSAGALARLGTKRSWIVHGESGLDEIALVGKTRVAEIKEGQVETFEISASDFGIGDAARDLPSNCSAAESAKLIREILNNERKGDDAEKLVLINAAAAIYVADAASDLRSAYLKGVESLRSRAALEKWKLLMEMTKQ